jgi:SM-20-related protein
MFDLLVARDFLDASSREVILDELRSAGAQLATVYGKAPAGAVDPHVRSAKRLAVTARTRELVLARLIEWKPAIEKHFGVALDRCEEAQFLRYETGDFFVAHQDGNTPLVHDDSRFRRISTIVFLSPPESYEGGSLVFRGRYPDFETQTAGAECGSMLAFRSETTHEVTPVTSGQRYTIASWYR